MSLREDRFDPSQLLLGERPVRCSVRCLLAKAFGVLSAEDCFFTKSAEDSGHYSSVGIPASALIRQSELLT